MTFESISRRGILGVFAATTVAAAPVMANAFGLLRGAGDIRRIRMYSGRTGESIDTVYWVEGKYIRDALNEINVFMRDWRTGQAIGIDPVQLGIIVAVNLSIGLFTPPIGTTLFISSSIARQPIGAVVRELWPFYLVAFTVLMLFTFIPALTIY